jgi:hypothetical protein
MIEVVENASKTSRRAAETPKKVGDSFIYIQIKSLTSFSLFAYVVWLETSCLYTVLVVAGCAISFWWGAR